jgi:1-deoxy-D-xylulose-5-phosphate synthase
VLERYARRVSAIVTFEDHVLSGGFGSAVVEALNQLNLSVPVVRIGWPDQFIEHGKVDQLRERHGVTVDAAYNQLQQHLAGVRHRTRIAI